MGFGRLGMGGGLGKMGRVGGGSSLAWIPNPANKPDIAINWKTNKAWTATGGLTTPAALGITTSRASVKQVVDSGGNWTQVASNVTAMSDLGRSTEEARTNSIRNNTMVGAIIGADNVEFLTNGNFASSGTGWTSNATNGATVTFSIGSVNIVGDGVAQANGYIAQQISGLTIGRNYVLSIVGSTTLAVAVGTSAGNGSVVAFTTLLAGNGTNQTVPDRIGFTATATSHWITLGAGSATSHVISSVSVKDGERVENGGFTSSPTNASINVVQNGWQWKVNGGTGTVVWNGSSAVTLTGDGVNAAVISASISTLIGATYTITADITGNTGSVQAGNSAYSTALLNTTSGTTTGQKFQFTATATTTFVSFFHSQATATVIANVSVQSAGAYPTNWVLATFNTQGVINTVIGLGTESGIDYMDVRINGTTIATISGVGAGTSESATQIAALPGQTWSSSIFAYIVGGSTTNITGLAHAITSNNSGGSSQQAFPSSVISSTTGPLGNNRVTVSATMALNTTAFINSRVFQLSASSGVAIDITLRIGWPQLENNSISSTVASATKVADGTGGVNGSGVYSIAGTGTAATLNCTWAAGVLTVNSVASAGSYTVFPVAGAALTYVSGAATGWTGATVNSVPTDLSANAFVTSPIKTTAAAATRAADVTTMLPTFGSAWTMFSQSLTNQSLNAPNNPRILSVNAASSTNTSDLLFDRGTGRGQMALTVGGVSQYATSLSATNYIGVSVKVAFALADGAQAATIGGAAATLKVVSPIITPTKINFGSQSGGSYLNGLAAIDAIWLTQAVPSAQLVTMTT